MTEKSWTPASSPTSEGGMTPAPSETPSAAPTAAPTTTATTPPPSATTTPPPGTGGPSNGQAFQAVAGKAAGKAAETAGKAAEKVGDGMQRGAKTIWRTLAERRGLRVAVSGVALILVGLWLGSDSALSVPVLVVGLVMLIAGAMGPRLRGTFQIDFGPAGTSINIHTHVAAPGRVAPPLPGHRHIALVPPVHDAEVVEGSGETVEIDVAQLKALLAQHSTTATQA